MATALEDEDLIAQAQERERARLEEEARILAFQQQQQAALPPPVWAGSPTAEIDAFNAAPGVISAPTTIDSAQYANELARAQRGSGYIAADVGPMGNVTVPGYDPSKDFAALKAQQEATNLQRNQYVNSLVQGGATYAEAFRAGQGRYPQTGNESMRLRVEQLAQKTQPFTPRVQMVNGVQMMQTGPNQWRPAPQPKFVGGKASEATRIAADNIADQITALRRQIAPDSSGLVLLAPEKVAEIEARIAQKEKQRVDLFNTPEANPQVDQPSWLRMRDAFNRASIPVAPTAATPTQTEVITITSQEQFAKLPSGSVYAGKDGKKYRKP